ncbi:MAG: aldehyde dehydrogenase family protein [Streptomyces sp.]|nr:aldehyde dehydrogenase family protein [Streptomyces sp.]
MTLELGGNDPAIVLDDADINATLDRMFSGVFTRTGQICFAVKRTTCRAPASTPSPTPSARVAESAVGHGLDQKARCGPLNNRAQFDKVTVLIEATKNSGAQVVEFGSRLESCGNGYYMQPM